MNKYFYVVACLYDTNKVNSALEFITLLQKVLKRTEYELVVILVLNNKKLGEKLNAEPNVHLLAGSNDNAEFGAWQEGIEYIKTLNLHNQNQSKFIFFNDTVFHHFIPSYTGILDFFNDLNETESCGVVSGQVMSLPVNSAVMGKPVNKYICSALFYLNYKALSDIEFTLLHMKVSDVPEKNTSYELLTEFFDEDALSYRIGAWLFGGGWYRSEKFKLFDKKLLKVKLAAIINEKALSAELLKSGCTFKQSLKTPFKPHKLYSIYNLVTSMWTFLTLYGLINLINATKIRIKYKSRNQPITDPLK